MSFSEVIFENEQITNEHPLLIQESRIKVNYWLKYQYCINPYPLDDILPFDRLIKQTKNNVYVHNTKKNNNTELKIKCGTKLKKFKVRDSYNRKLSLQNNIYQVIIKN